MIQSPPRVHVAQTFQPAGLGDILVAMKRNWKVPPTSRQECLLYKDIKSPALLMTFEPFVFPSSNDIMAAQ
jgi:hypothetical protein